MLFFFQAEDGIRYLVRSRGLGDVYKRQMTEDSRYYYPATPISKNIYIFNDDTMPLKMEIVGYQYTEGILNNFSRHISLYNEKGHLLDYKNYDQNGTMIRHEKYLLDAVGIRSATINFTNNDKDSIIIYKEEDYGLPFNNTISDYNSLVKSDTIESVSYTHLTLPTSDLV